MLTLFDALDAVCEAESDWDSAFWPHVWWGPFENLRVKKKLWTDRDRDFYSQGLLVAFTWDVYELEIEIVLHEEIPHDCIYCRCEIDLEEPLRETIEYRIEDYDL